MIVPYIAAVSREVLLAVPASQREAALAMGATRWEAVRSAVLPYGRAGLIGAVILGPGRALGQTMALTILIGNRPDISISALHPPPPSPTPTPTALTQPTPPPPLPP